MPPALLGEILVRDGACSEAALRDALENQVIFGGRLGTNLLELNAVSEEALSHALAKQHGVPAMFGRMRLDRAAVALVKPELADRCEALPYLAAGRSLAVLVANPKDLAMLDEVAFATGKEVHPIVVPEARVWALLREAYGVDRHLRGIDVPFARLRRVEQAPRGPAAAKPPGEDLMDEGAFDALYGRVGLTHAPPPRPAEEVVDVDLGDLLAPAPPVAAPPTARPTPPPRVAPAEVLAALAASPGHAPPARLLRPPVSPPDAREPSPLAFQEAVRFLEGVDDRNAIANTVLRYARSKFGRAVLFTVHRGVARGWAGLGEGLGAGAARRIQLSLDGPGIVETVVRTRAHFLGPIPKTDANIRLLRALGGGVPGNAFLVPILVLGRVVNVFYADSGRGRVVDAGDVGELLILATRIAKSYDALLARVRVRV